MTNPYHWWQQALAGAKPEVHEDQPQLGYYKKREGKDGPWVACAIWMSGDKMVCRIGKRMADPVEEWTWLARYPISQDEARGWMTTGQWPSDDRPPPAGHNRPDDPFEALKFDIDAELEVARELCATPVDNQQVADRYGNRIAVLRELSSKAEKTRKAEKEPHLEAGRAVDAAYKPLVDQLDKAVKHLRSLVGKWMATEEARLREEQRKAEEERAAAEAKQREAEKAAEKANLPPPPQQEPLPTVPDAKVKVGGIRGKAVHLKTERRCVITDHKKALRKFADHDEVKALVAKLAERALRDGEKVPGAELVEERVAA